MKIPSSPDSRSASPALHLLALCALPKASRVDRGFTLPAALASESAENRVRSLEKDVESPVFKRTRSSRKRARPSSSSEDIAPSRTLQDVTNTGKNYRHLPNSDKLSPTEDAECERSPSKRYRARRPDSAVASTSVLSPHLGADSGSSISDITPLPASGFNFSLPLTKPFTDAHPLPLLPSSGHKALLPPALLLRPLPSATSSPSTPTLSPLPLPKLPPGDLPLALATGEVSPHGGLLPPVSLDSISPLPGSNFPVCTPSDTRSLSSAQKSDISPSIACEPKKATVTASLPLPLDVSSLDSHRSVPCSAALETSSPIHRRHTTDDAAPSPCSPSPVAAPLVRAASCPVVVTTSLNNADAAELRRRQRPSANPRATKKVRFVVPTPPPPSLSARGRAVLKARMARTRSNAVPGIIRTCSVYSRVRRSYSSSA